MRARRQPATSSDRPNRHDRHAPTLRQRHRVGAVVVAVVALAGTLVVAAPTADASRRPGAYWRRHRPCIRMACVVPRPAPGPVPNLGGCNVFPATNAWNTRVDGAGLNTNSAAYINFIGASKTLHPDFGGGGTYGIPFVVVPGSTPGVPINFTAYGDESDPGPYPIPYDAPVEGAPDTTGDRHVLVLQAGTCKLYELYRSFVVGTPGSYRWDADSGAIWDLNTGALRPAGWTSADAAGLPILPGLVRYDEVAAGAVNHAIRFTVRATQNGYILPATHFASSSSDPTRPPMGLRLRLKSGYDISGLPVQARVIAQALKNYGLIVADNGSDWFFQGDTDVRWDDTQLNTLKTIPGSAFEAVDSGPILH